MYPELHRRREAVRTGFLFAPNKFYEPGVS